MSTNSPVSWQWFFTGAVPDTSTLQNPTGICYNNYGSFDVTLIACNTISCDTVTFTNFIQEFQNPTDSIWQSNDTLFSIPAYSYQWYETSTGVLTGQTQQFLVTTQAGNYFCIVSDSIGCIATSNTISITTSINENALNASVQIIPNPNNGTFAFVFNNEIKNKNFSLSVYDATGRIVFENQFYDLSKQIEINLNSGFYILELKSDNMQIRKKVVVEK